MSAVQDSKLLFGRQPTKQLSSQTHPLSVEQFASWSISWPGFVQQMLEHLSVLRSHKPHAGVDTFGVTWIETLVGFQEQFVQDSLLSCIF